MDWRWRTCRAAARTGKSSGAARRCQTRVRPRRIALCTPPTPHPTLFTPRPLYSMGDEKQLFVSVSSIQAMDRMLYSGQYQLFINNVSKRFSGHVNVESRRASNCLRCSLWLLTHERRCEVRRRKRRSEPEFWASQIWQKNSSRARHFWSCP